MAISYDQRKKSYDSMDDAQKQQYNEAIKNKGDDYIGNQYMKQYQQANTPQSNNNSSNFNNLTKEYQDGNGWRSMNYDDWKKEYEGMDDAGKQGYSKFLDSQNDDYWGRGFLDTYKQEQVANANPELDTSKFGATNGQVTVKEGTAAQTGMPDYQLNSEARMREITDNLNAYWANNPEFFKDRQTFNQMFHYSERDEDQKALLDTYWKKKQDMDAASKYTNGDSIAAGMKDYAITPDQLNYIQSYNPEAYREWQQKQLDEINLRIANLATPRDETDVTELFNSLVQKLNLDSGDPYQIYDNWYSMCERLGVFSDSEKLKSYQNQLDANHAKMEGIVSRYSASTGGTVSDALAAARMQKALAPYQQIEVDLQNSYTTLLNGRNSNLAVANQSASVLAMQAQEDQRIFNQRLQGLGFAMSTASYRSPEQQAQLQLQTQQLSNEMNLLYQSQANDLNLYNQYATTKLQNQLNAELTDLSVEDENQLRANLTNVLSGYYDQWGAIIERPMSEVVDDVIAYAKANNISVAEALRQNFIKPLQSKKEYKMKVSQDYGMDKYQQKWSYSIDEDGNISITSTGYGEIPESAFKSRDSRQDAYGNVYEESMTWAEYIENLAGSIKDGSYGGQCGAFCNDVLIGGGEDKIFGNTLADKIAACNVKKEEGPQVGYAVVFDLGFTSKDGENHGHVGWISAVNGDGSIDVLESNGKSDETIHVKRYSKAAVDQMVMGYYKPDVYDVQKEVASPAEERAKMVDPYSGVSGYTSKGVEVNAGGWITDLEDSFMSTTRMSDSERNDLYKSYGIDTQTYNAMKKNYVDYQAKVTLIKEAEDMYNAIDEMLQWNQKYSSDGGGSRHKGNIDEATYNTVYKGENMENIKVLGIKTPRKKYDSQTANGINKYSYIKNNQLLEKYKQLKENGATFGQMSNSEWGLVGTAASQLNWWSTDEEFERILKEMKDHYTNILAEAGVEGFYSTDI